MAEPLLDKLFDLDDPTTYPPPPKELIKGILYTPMLTLMWGEPFSGKSHIAIDLACSLAQSYPIIYIAAEAPYEIRKRGAAWMQYYNLSCNHNFKGLKEPLNIMDKESVNVFITAASSIKPKVVFIDPLAQCFTEGNPDSTMDMTKATSHMHKICRKLDCAVCIVAHAGRDTSHVRGSTALDGAVRVSLKISRVEGKVKMESVAINSGPKIKDRYFRIVQVGDDEMQTILLPDIIEKSDVKSTLTTKQREVLLMLNLETFKTGVTRSELKLAMGATNAIYEIINVLIKKDLAGFKSESSPLIVITDEGRYEASLVDMNSDSSIHLQPFNWTIASSENSSCNSIDSGSFISNSGDFSYSHSSIHPPSPPYKGEGVNENEIHINEVDKKVN